MKTIRTGVENKIAPKPAAVPVFLKPESVGPRKWGEELMLHVEGAKRTFCPGYSLKLLKLNAGHGGGLQIHRKAETQYVISGKYEFTWDPGDGTLSQTVFGPGDAVHIPPGAVHQGIAVTDCEIIEVGNPVLNDRVNVAELYGLELTPGSLPSTADNEITLLE